MKHVTPVQEGPDTKGQTDVEFCREQGWGVGTEIEPMKGLLSMSDDNVVGRIWFITALGEDDILMRRVRSRSHGKWYGDVGREVVFPLKYARWRRVGKE